jgi:hypothetical protein
MIYSSTSIPKQRYRDVGKILVYSPYLQTTKLLHYAYYQIMVCIIPYILGHPTYVGLTELQIFDINGN